MDVCDSATPNLLLYTRYYVDLRENIRYQANILLRFCGLSFSLFGMSEVLQCRSSLDNTTVDLTATFRMQHQHGGDVSN